MIFVIFFTAGDLLLLFCFVAVAMLVAGSGVADIFTWISDNSITLFMVSMLLGLVGAIIYYYYEKDICFSWALFADVPLVPTTIVFMASEVVKDFRTDITYGFFALLPNILIACVLFAVFILLMIFGLWGMSAFFGDIEDGDYGSDIWRFFRALIVCIVQNIIVFFRVIKAVSWVIPTKQFSINL